jgi:hypothetical protein
VIFHDGVGFGGVVSFFARLYRSVLRAAPTVVASIRLRNVVLRATSGADESLGGELSQSGGKDAVVDGGEELGGV